RSGASAQPPEPSHERPCRVKPRPCTRYKAASARGVSRDHHGNLSAMRLRLLSVPVRVLATAVCALATHALMYRTLWPSDAVHGYLGWYEPLVGALSLASLFGLVALVAVAPAARRRGLSFHVGARSLAYS